MSISSKEVWGGGNKATFSWLFFSTTANKMFMWCRVWGQMRRIDTCLLMTKAVTYARARQSPALAAGKIRKWVRTLNEPTCSSPTQLNSGSFKTHSKHAFYNTYKQTWMTNYLLSISLHWFRTSGSERDSFEINSTSRLMNKSRL